LKETAVLKPTVKVLPGVRLRRGYANGVATRRRQNQTRKIDRGGDPDVEKSAILSG
jgi:hypothetical protein